MIGLLVILLGVILGFIAIFVGALDEILSFPWRKRIRGLTRFSLAPLLGFVASICVALGIRQLQIESQDFLFVPFPVCLAICFALCATGFAIARDFRRNQGGTALAAFRARRQQQPLAPPTPSNREDTNQRTRKKWWLRRKPNRIRSLGRRDMETCQGYYIRDD